MLKETDEEYLLLEESFRDMSVEQVNRTLNESQAALDMLQTEAESLLELSTNPGDESALDIAKQMRAIQQKQRELMSMQMALQQRLAARIRRVRACDLHPWQLQAHHMINLGLRRMPHTNHRFLHRVGGVFADLQPRRRRHGDFYHHSRTTAGPIPDAIFNKPR